MNESGALRKLLVSHVISDSSGVRHTILMDRTIKQNTGCDQSLGLSVRCELRWQSKDVLSCLQGSREVPGKRLLNVTFWGMKDSIDT